MNQSNPESKSKSELDPQEEDDNDDDNDDNDDEMMMMMMINKVGRCIPFLFVLWDVAGIDRI